MPVATWVAAAARQHDGFEVEVVDLAEINLPLFDEPNHPRLQQYTQDHSKRWSEIIARGDAYVFVHPEYNYSMNAALKNAIDYLHIEWANKPAGLVSYGGVAAGQRAAQALKVVIGALRMYVVPEAVPIPFVAKSINDDGEFVPNELMETGAQAMFNSLLALTNALSPLRS